MIATQAPVDDPAAVAVRALQQVGDTPSLASLLPEAPAAPAAPGDDAEALAAPRLVGGKVAELAKSKGVEKVVFDKGGHLYHGKVAAVADGARAAGLDF